MSNDENLTPPPDGDVIPTDSSTDKKRSYDTMTADSDPEAPPMDLVPDSVKEEVCVKDELEALSDEDAPALPTSLMEIDLSKTKSELIEAMDPEDRTKFREAESRRLLDDKAVRSTHSRLLKAKIELTKAQQKLEECHRAYQEAKEKAELNMEKDADHLLLEPTSWNTYYRQLKSFYDREGHCNFKRTVSDADVLGMNEEAEKELRTLSWWTCRQRKFKRRGELDQYKIFLLNRLNFDWSPHAGPGPEKWIKSYNLLKEFKTREGHVKVPVKHLENEFKLGSWLKTQITQYRNSIEGRQPALSSERMKLLDDIGVSWGEKRLTTPWESRFADLMDFRRRFGHVNVPWQWKDNVPLAQWVNSQRKKYKDNMDGKRNNLTEEQIRRLNEIGFKWSTGGRGRYSNETDQIKKEIDTSSSPEGIDDSVPQMITSNDAESASRTQAAVAMLQGNMFPGASIPNFNDGSSGTGAQGCHPNFFGNRLSGSFGGLAGGDTLAMNEQAMKAYAQRLAQQNQQDLSYFSYAYHMNNLNNQFHNPTSMSQMRDQIQRFGINGGNQFFGSQL